MSIEAFGSETTAEQVTEGLDLAGKRYVVTGCNSGLGLETTRVLGMRGAHVIGLARTEEKAAKALADSGAEGTPLACELSEAKSVRACAEALVGLERPVDGFICNAGIMALPEPRTTHGFDLQFLTNHIGHFILVTKSLETLSDEGRVVILSSGAHRMAPEAGIEFDNLSGQRDYQPWKMYGQSKLANILFARRLARDLEGTKKTANAVHPGVIRTNLTRHLDNAEELLGTMTLKTVPQGAATQCLVATHPDVEAVSGKYFSNCQVAPTLHPHAEDDALADALWSRSEEIANELLA